VIQAIVCSSGNDIKKAGTLLKHADSPSSPTNSSAFFRPITIPPAFRIIFLIFRKIRLSNIPRVLYFIGGTFSLSDTKNKSCAPHLKKDYYFIICLRGLGLALVFMLAAYEWAVWLGEENEFDVTVGQIWQTRMKCFFKRALRSVNRNIMGDADQQNVYLRRLCLFLLTARAKIGLLCECFTMPPFCLGKMYFIYITDSCTFVLLLGTNVKWLTIFVYFYFDIF